MRAVITKNTIIDDLKSLGIEKGDIIFIAADLMRTGFFIENRAKTLTTWVDIFRELVGETGTIVIPAYTKAFYRFNNDKNYVFNEMTIPESGNLSEAFFSYGDVERSQHPTNSVFALGPDAKKIIAGHDSTSKSYLPYSRVIELGGKNLMLGCLNDKKFAPMAIHAAQEMLGYTDRHYLSGHLQVYYEKPGGDIDLFTRRDIGGCTAFGYKFLGHHLLENAMVVSKVGRSNSALIDTKKSFDIFLAELKNHPQNFKCDNASCASCYGSFVYNGFNALLYWIANGPTLIRKVSKKLLIRARKNSDSNLS